MIAAVLALVLLPARPGAAEIEALRDPSRDVREQAIARLADKAQPVDNALALLREEDERVRRGACAALGRRGEPSTIPALLIEGSDAAAEACVRIAESSRLELPSIAKLATPAMRERLVRVHAAALHKRIGSVGGHLQLSRPQIHRAHFAGGVWSERLLLAIARDPSQPAKKRAHAMHVAQLMLGRTMRKDLVRLLDATEPEVRRAALTLLWRLHTASGNRELAKLLDRGEQYPASQVSLLVSVVDQGAKPGPEGMAFLAARVRKGPASIAADAAGVLMELEREKALALLTARVRDEIHRSDGPQVALFFLRCGTPTPELEKLADRSKAPLARLAAFPTSPRSKTRIQDHLDPKPGPFEWVRIRVVSLLLARQPATWQDRVRFAQGLLRSDQASWRATGLGALRGAPDDVLKPLRPRLMVSLQDPVESVRVKAAVLLMPAPGAQRVLWAALFDGDLRTAWSAGPALDPALGRNTPVAERRRRARQALVTLDRR